MEGGQMRTTDAILAMLPTYPEAMTTAELSSRLDLESRDVSARLCQLQRRGLVLQARPQTAGPYGYRATWAKPAVVEEVNP